MRKLFVAVVFSTLLFTGCRRDEPDIKVRAPDVKIDIDTKDRDKGIKVDINSKKGE